MRIFIDEAGSFSWRNPGRSIFCAVTVADRDLEALLDRFVRWGRSVIGHSTRELKGAEMTDNQLSSFAAKVLPATDRDLWLTAVGIDTTVTKESIVIQLRDQAATIFDQSSRIAEEHHNPRLQESYRQMSGWVKNRSPQNIAWLIGLVETVAKSLHHTIVRFTEPQYDEEFKIVKTMIDQGFVQRDEHVAFWRECLRMDLTKPSRTEPLITPREWRERRHPFVEKYCIYPWSF